jgi:hypothetical protein
MQASDKIYQAGLAHYAEALYAVSHFERVIIEKTEAIAEPRLSDLARPFGVEKFDGGSPYVVSPGRSDISKVTLPTMWAWVGKQWYIAGYSNCFLGMLVDLEKVYAAICFSNYRKDFRDMLNPALCKEQQKYGYIYNYYPREGETVVSVLLDPSACLEAFGSALTQLIQAVIHVVDANLSLRPAPIAAGQAEGLIAP